MTERVQTIPVMLLDGTRLEGGWVDLFKIGSQVRYRGAVIKVDPSFAARLLANFARYLVLYGKEPVMLRQHEREGWQYGAWAALRVESGWIQGLAGFLDDAALALFRAGQLREWSPGFGDVEDPHTGELLEDMMVEASFVDRAHQWNLRPPSVTNPPVQLAATEIYTMETVMPAETQTELETAPAEVQMAEDMAEDMPEDEQPFDLAAAFGALTSTLTSMAEGQARIMAHLMPDEGKPPSDLAAVQSRVVELEAQLTLRDLADKGITGDVARGLVELKSAAPKMYAATVAGLEAQFKRPTPRVQKPIGGTASAQTDAAVPVERLVELAGEHTPRNGSVMPWINRNHPDRAEEVAAHLKLV